MKEKVERLTPEQEAMLPVYRQKWLDIGTDSTPLNEERKLRAADLIKAIYKDQGRGEPKVYFASSPMEGARKAQELSGDGPGVVYSCFYGQHDGYWLSLWDYMRNELGLKEETESVANHIEFAKIAGWAYTYDEAVVICDKPEVCTLDEQGSLHNFDGPAIRYRDGYEIYSIHGIEVTKQIIMKDKDSWTKEEILGETNADIRRAIIQMLGSEKVLAILGGETVDEKFGYELINIDYGDKEARPHLKMVNPSLNALHVEGVGTDCKTVEDAICFRNGLTEFKLPRTLDGKPAEEVFGPRCTEFIGNYDQQGDAIFKDVDAIPSDAVVKQDRVCVAGLRRHTSTDTTATVYEGYLAAPNGDKIVHQGNDHGDLFLRAGNYKVDQVLEYDHALEEQRKVID